MLLAAAVVRHGGVDYHESIKRIRTRRLREPTIAEQSRFMSTHYPSHRFIASLMVPGVALALMAGRALAAEPQMPDFNLTPLFELLDMINRSWLGTLENYDSNRWNGVWPDPTNGVWPDPLKGAF